jgi:LmbE family N-acetylglucosaminyl deacetylase
MKPHLGSINSIEHSVTGEKLSLLAVFARPEDEAFGPSGTLAKYAGEGVRVSLVTAARELESLARRRASEPALAMLDTQHLQREMLCSCRAAGIQRICLDQISARSAGLLTNVLQERLVRLIREVQPQVLVTYAPNGLSNDPHQMVVNQLAQRAFQLAGDANAYPQHAREGLYAYTPQKLYYAVLPQSIIKRWKLEGLNGVPDDQVTTILDVSPYSEMKLKAVYCQRHHSQDFTRWLQANSGMEWNEEHFILAASHLARRPRKERDLFAGLR